MLWWAVRGRLPLDRRAPSLRTLLTASVPLAAMALLEQAVLKLDAFVLGLRFPSEVVGTAGLAVYAVFFFPRMLADSIGRALYPALVRFGEDPPRLFDAFRVATVFLASFSVPMSFFLFVNAELAVLFLGGDRWLGAADYLRILSLVPLVRPLAMFGLELLLTRHMDRLLIAYTATNLLALGGLGLYLTSTDLGPNGMAVAGYFPLGLLFLTWGIWRLDRSGLLRLGRELLEIDGIAAALFLPIWWLIPATAAWTRFGLSAVAGLVVVAFAAWRFGSGWRRFLEGASA
ncbi:MAG: oligosaccharide flippase family protein, partial [Acidobacteriota bacterium]